MAAVVTHLRRRLAALVRRPRLHLIRFRGVLAPNAKLRALVVPQGSELLAQEAKPAKCEAACAHHRPARLSWAKLLRRVLDLDLRHCPNCGGRLKIIAAILEQPVIERILTHLGLQAAAARMSTDRCCSNSYFRTIFDCTWSPNWSPMSHQRCFLDQKVGNLALYQATRANIAC